MESYAKSRHPPTPVDDGAVPQRKSLESCDGRRDRDAGYQYREHVGHHGQRGTGAGTTDSVMATTWYCLLSI